MTSAGASSHTCKRILPFSYKDFLSRVSDVPQEVSSCGLADADSSSSGGSSPEASAIKVAGQDVEVWNDPLFAQLRAQHVVDSSFLERPLHRIKTFGKGGSPLELLPRSSEMIRTDRAPELL
ncbi:unnamed protein product [Polarella glacialis]|uniref:Uncharacterized protein n=1 Tax=Polarella glacialis TaxID=89957 RepID=A0A813I1Z4_POLGL|nr:unnamed protein product [Polarella glacialis]